MWGKRNAYTLLVGMQTSTTTLENKKVLFSSTLTENISSFDAD
jgi:hypothetical protein